MAETTWRLARQEEWPLTSSAIRDRFHHLSDQRHWPLLHGCAAESRRRFCWNRFALRCAGGPTGKCEITNSAWREDRRHVVKRFLWQQAQAAQLDEIACAGAFNCSLKRRFASVVRRKGQRPGTKLLVEIAQIVRRGTSRPLNIQSIVP
jgi:hypothetical protein